MAWQDKSGELDVSELRAALQKCKPGETITNNQVKKRISKYDVDGNGTLSFTEYENMLKSWEEDEKSYTLVNRTNNEGEVYHVLVQARSANRARAKRGARERARPRL